MKKGFLALWLLLVGMPSPGNDDLAMKISLRDKPTTAVGKFDKYEIAFDLSRQYDDPFDPEAINIEARFTAPSGREIAVCAFYYLDYPHAELMKRCKRGVSYEQPPAVGGHAGTHWRVRFAPQEEGQYRVCLVAKDKQDSSRPDLPAVAPRLRGKQCFLLPISYQTVSIKGTPADIHAEARRLYDLLGSPKGGFIRYVEEYSVMGMSPENYRACGQAFRALSASCAGK